MPAFHSFPRTCPSNKDAIEFGLEILKSVVDIGLVLAPEFFSFDEIYQDGKEATLTVGQKRFCLTDIDAGSLTDHSKVFGNFSIEWSHAVAMQMGAMPVFYFPEMVKGASGLSNLSATLICRLAETRQLLDALDQLRKQLAVSNQDNPTCLTQVENGDTVWIETPSTLRLLNHLDKNYRGLFALSASIRSLAQLFVPTHNSNYTNVLAYYRQREWRILNDIAIEGRPTSRILTEHEKKQLLALNPDFFGKVIETFTGGHRRVDECWVYVDYEGKHPLSRASRLIVPEVAVEAARAILIGARIELPVVGLESLTAGRS